MSHAAAAASTPPRCVMLVGANGFLGGYIAAALREAGHRVLRGVRSPRAGADERQCDLARMTAPTDSHGTLEGVDAVVNAAGILRQGSAVAGNGSTRRWSDHPAPCQ